MSFCWTGFNRMPFCSSVISVMAIFG